MSPKSLTSLFYFYVLPKRHFVHRFNFRRSKIFTLTIGFSLQIFHAFLKYRFETNAFATLKNIFYSRYLTQMNDFFHHHVWKTFYNLLFHIYHIYKYQMTPTLGRQKIEWNLSIHLLTWTFMNLRMVFTKCRQKVLLLKNKYSEGPL